MASISEPNSPSSSSLKHKLKSTLCSFQKHSHHHRHHVTFNNSEKHVHQKHDLYAVQEAMNAESQEDIRGNKTSYLSSCIGKHGHRHGRGHRRRHTMSANFHYDATSYALNFDEGKGNDEGTRSCDSRLMDFSSRLPPSPTRDTDGCAARPSMIKSTRLDEECMISPMRGDERLVIEKRHIINTSFLTNGDRPYGPWPCRPFGTDFGSHEADTSPCTWVPIYPLARPNQEIKTFKQPTRYGRTLKQGIFPAPNPKSLQDNVLCVDCDTGSRANVTETPQGLENWQILDAFADRSRLSNSGSQKGFFPYLINESTERFP
ncbi:hypothetical protein POTOM_057527 [Populus tomentosa]|uniref:Uncharacterized protein n=1 Tax=Populus tomentosa TaxID=118781 RepID=A0A8X8C1V0_POPTO|nr:hypothetical protein POTOM_057527 [Populus tomentosa]